MDSIDYLLLPYKWWFIWDDVVGGCSAGIEEFPGCVADGNSFVGAYFQLQHNALAWIEVEIENGHEIPAPMILED